MLKRLHRYLGLTFALLWLMQVATGALLVFRWELDDATVSVSSVSSVRTDPEGLGARISMIEHDGGKVSSLWASSPAASRFDIYYLPAAGGARVMRVDGMGGVLRDGPSDALIHGGGLFNSLTRLHESLFAGEAGSWLIGLSGLALLTSMIMGLQLAWPRRGAWRLLVSRPRGPPLARRYGWHRVLGLWIAIPAMLVVSAGTLLAFRDGVEHVLARMLSVGAAIPASGGDFRGARAADAESVGVVDATYALSRAFAEHPGAILSALLMPGESHPWFEVRVRRPKDMPRVWGTTTLRISSSDGARIDAPADSASRAHQFTDLIYPAHTGQFAGVPSRLLLMLVGIGLLVMMTFGLGLWSAKRARPVRCGRRNP